MATQTDWRFCIKCNQLFFDGYPNKGVCSAGGGHQSGGYKFVLPHDMPETSNAQSLWRFCNKCNTMFFDGYPGKGVCSAGGGHQSTGYVFVLPHDIPQTANAQSLWRFCKKCNAMFFDGYAAKGVCSAGGGHLAAGYNFVLPHPINPSVKIEIRSGFTNPGNPDLTPTSASIHGLGFTPGGNIKAAYTISVDPPNAIPRRTSSGNLTGMADNNGGFILDIPMNAYDLANYFQIAGRATDAVTNIYADGEKYRNTQ